MEIKDIFLTACIILIPSWTVAYVTDKVVYVIPMLAVTTFVVAQVIQHRRNRRLDKDETNQDVKNEDGMKDSGMRDEGDG